MNGTIFFSLASTVFMFILILYFFIKRKLGIRNNSASVQGGVRFGVLGGGGKSMLASPSVGASDFTSFEMELWPVSNKG